MTPSDSGIMEESFIELFFGCCTYKGTRFPFRLTIHLNIQLLHLSHFDCPRFLAIPLSGIHLSIPKHDPPTPFPHPIPNTKPNKHCDQA
jgi:hypothetical protein